jgi:hypothetical protein
MLLFAVKCAQRAPGARGTMSSVDFSGGFNFVSTFLSVGVTTCLAIAQLFIIAQSILHHKSSLNINMLCLLQTSMQTPFSSVRGLPRTGRRQGQCRQPGRWEPADRNDERRKRNREETINVPRHPESHDQSAYMQSTMERNGIYLPC